MGRFCICLKTFAYLCHSLKVLVLTLMPINKRKIINDPVYGFINFPYEIIYDLMEHPWFQRLRRIRQLGLTSLVYPGTHHTRFQHALGATYLMGLAIEVIRSNGHEITTEEAEAVSIAILLHDIGHGPFSHALEHSIVEGIDHEEISLLYMQGLNKQFNGKLSLAIEIFTDTYPKKFLHQLVDSQLDMDRLDYLRRDSFFSGVTEGIIGSDRIIKMLNVAGDQLVVDVKGIYSIEKFLVARRLMYWQVYFHKTTISSENLLLMVLKRAKYLAMNGVKLFGTPSLLHFLENRIKASQFRQENGEELLELFAGLDDTDILSAAKVWAGHSDKVLGILCRNLVNRKLFRVEVSTRPLDEDRIARLLKGIRQAFDLDEEEAGYLLARGEISNAAYTSLDDRIKILFKDGNILDITEASDMLNLQVLSKTVKKYFLCYPKELNSDF
jgi:HD superfamily phosphohydrolase